MNYCTKCASLYAQPGTCNCYATVAKPAQPLTTPYVPYIPTVTPGYPPIVPQVTPWWGVMPPNSGIAPPTLTVTSGYSVRVDQMPNGTCRTYTSTAKS